MRKENNGYGVTRPWVRPKEQVSWTKTIVNRLATIQITKFAQIMYIYDWPVRHEPLAGTLSTLFHGSYTHMVEHWWPTIQGTELGLDANKKNQPVVRQTDFSTIREHS